MGGDVSKSRKWRPFTQIKSRLGNWTQVWVLGLAALLFLVRISGPSTLMDKDQERPAAYVLDVLQNGNWLCPHDWTGAPTSKPPLSVWIASLVVTAAGHASLWALCSPGFLGIAGAAGILGIWGNRIWGNPAGLLAGILFLLSPLPIKLIALNRTDGLFTFTVVLTAFLAWRARARGTGWIAVGIAAAAATLTKGPLGVVLGGMGLLAGVWDRSSATSRISRRELGVGVVLFFAITLSWLGAAVWVEGGGVLRKLFGDELVGHALDPTYGSWGRGLYLTPAYFMSRFLPWSPIAAAGLFRSWHGPHPDEAQQRSERFLVFWLVGGLTLMAMGTHQRGDLVAPLLPPAALLAAGTIARWTQRLPRRVVHLGIATASVVGLVAAWTSDRVQAHSRVVQRSEGMRELADSVRRSFAPGTPVVIVDAPFALQVHLNQVQPPVSYKAAAAVLVTQPGALVAVTDLQRLRRSFPVGTSLPLQVVETWPTVGTPWVQIVQSGAVSASARRGE
jgi:4-amino-4-deoxy-L-arabinose transferase-like glycosyltransferase